MPRKRTVVEEVNTAMKKFDTNVCQPHRKLTNTLEKKVDVIQYTLDNVNVNGDDTTKGLGPSLKYIGVVLKEVRTEQKALAELHKSQRAWRTWLIDTKDLADKSIVVRYTVGILNSKAVRAILKVFGVLFVIYFAKKLGVDISIDEIQKLLGLG